MAASDFLLHPSLLDSSCVTVKEAGLAKLPVIVCRGVGDFDDYVRDGENGFLADRDKFVEESVKIIKQNFTNENLLKKIGTSLRDSVIEQFSIENVIHQYDSLNNVK